MYLQINVVKCDVDQEITNIYKNLQIVWSRFSPICYYLLIFGLLQISIGLLVFRFVANEYNQITIGSLSTIRNIRPGIWWAITKVILNYSQLPSGSTCWTCLGYLKWCDTSMTNHICVTSAKVAKASPASTAQSK